MKTINFLLICLLFSSSIFGQDSLWKSTKVNDIFILNIPSDGEYVESSFIKAYSGYVGQDVYVLQFYDTIFNKIETSEQFEIALKGFLSGRLADSSLKNYRVLITDTAVGGMHGLMAKFNTNDTSKFPKQIYYFVTVANSRFYWFYTYTGSESDIEKINFFFKSVKFDVNRIKENGFKFKFNYSK